MKKDSKILLLDILDSIKKIAGTRDIIIHDYSGVDADLVWEIINKDIPKLKKQISKLLDYYSLRKDGGQKRRL